MAIIFTPPLRIIGSQPPILPLVGFYDEINAALNQNIKVFNEFMEKVPPEFIEERLKVSLIKLAAGGIDNNVPVPPETPDAPEAQDAVPEVVSVLTVFLSESRILFSRYTGERAVLLAFNL